MRWHNFRCSLEYQQLLWPGTLSEATAELQDNELGWISFEKVQSLQKQTCKVRLQIHFALSHPRCPSTSQQLLPLPPLEMATPKHVDLHPIWAWNSHNSAQSHSTSLEVEPSWRLPPLLKEIPWSKPGSNSLHVAEQLRQLWPITYSANRQTRYTMLHHVTPCYCLSFPSVHNSSSFQWVFVACSFSLALHTSFHHTMALGVHTVILWFIMIHMIHIVNVCQFTLSSFVIPSCLAITRNYSQ